MWAEVAKVVAAAAQAVFGYMQSRSDAAERDRKQGELLEAIELTRTSVISAVNAQTIAQLKGELEGYETRYAEYDARPQDEQSLVDIIAETANTLGWLGANIDSAPHRPGADPAAMELALESATVYIALMFLRVQVMMEHQVAWGAPAVRDIPPLLRRAIARLEMLRRCVRRESDDRFGPVQVTRSADYTSPVYGYRFDGRMIVCGPANRAGANAACDARRAQKMNWEYSRYRDGAGPVLAQAFESMSRVRADLLRPGGRLTQQGQTADPGGRASR